MLLRGAALVLTRVPALPLTAKGSPQMRGGPCWSPTCSGLPRLPLRVVGLCLVEIARRVCHELGQGRLVAEAIGLALNLRIDGAVRLYVLAVSEAHRAHVAVLAGHGESCSGHADEESACEGRTDVRSHVHLLSVGDLRRSFQKTIVHLGSSVSDRGHVFVTDFHLDTRPETGVNMTSAETQNRRPIVRVSSHDRERKA